LGLFALGTFGVACKTYANNKNANAFSSHISYLSLFQNYVGFEISKRISVDRNSADVLNWYNVIFPSSNVGDLRVSSNYITILREIDDCIKKSNEEFVGPAYKHFDYNVHQRRIIEILKRIGIELEPLPRSNFWSVEEEVLSLIEVVNASFFKLDDYNKFTKSNYR
ncbi:retron Ec48 family effector membrane protein, partial [Halomonas sp. AOP43-D1-39]